jgi:hypothetical protein
VRIAIGLALALCVAVLLTVAYFAISDSWTSLSSVVPGAVAILSGAAGFGVAVFLAA